MKAAIVRSLGSPLDVAETDTPSPSNHQALVSGEVSARLVFDLRSDVPG